MISYCVYVHKVKETFVLNDIIYLKDDIVYIGSGRHSRVTGISGRSEDHLKIWDKLDKIILYDNLSHTEKFDIEQKLINEHISSGKLLNKRSLTNKPKVIQYDIMSEWFYIDDTSPSYLRWLKSKSTKEKDKEVGYLTKRGYWVVGFNYGFYTAHRIIWCLYNKQDCPTDMVVDHIDGTFIEGIGKSNNPLNLRLVTQHTNTKNRLPNPNSSSGVIGVSWSKRDMAWISTIKSDTGTIRKYFTPTKLFPHDDFEIAKEKAKILAVEYRKQLELMYN